VICHVLQLMNLKWRRISGWAQNSKCSVQVICWTEHYKKKWIGRSYWYVVCQKHIELRGL